MGIDVTSNPRFEMGIPVSKQGCYYPPFEMGIPIPKRALMKRTIPISEQGSPFWYGDIRIPILKWRSQFWNGDRHNFKSSFWNGDTHIKTGMFLSPFQNGDPRSKTGIYPSAIPCFKTGMPVLEQGLRPSPFWNGYCPVTNQSKKESVLNWGFGGKIPDLEPFQNGVPILKWGFPV